MPRPIQMLLAALLCAPPGSGCLPRPKQDYAIEQIGQISSLEEIMRVQAQAMDPHFKKIGQVSFTDAELAALGDAARRVQAASQTVRDRFQGGRKESFAAYAGTLNAKAGELFAAAEARDTGKIGPLLQSIRQTCRGCHKEHR